MVSSWDVRLVFRFVVCFAFSCRRTPESALASQAIDNSMLAPSIHAPYIREGFPPVLRRVQKVELMKNGGRAANASPLC
jgi:hypothetical protein